MKKHLFFIAFQFCLVFAFSQTSITILSQTNSPCFNSCVGAVTFSISGATGPFTVTGGCTSTYSAAFSGSTVTLTGLCPCPGYNFIFFASGVPFPIGTKAVNITSPNPVIAVASKTNVCCNGLCNGVISYTATGGTPAYTYSWQPAIVGSTTAFANNLCAGNYTMTVTDGNACIYSFTNNITQPAPLTLSLSSGMTTCSSCCNGSVSSSASGGTSPYTYTIFPGGASNSSGTFTNVCTGTYSVCVSDNGCCSTCNGITVISTGLNEIMNGQASVSVFPNPGNGKIFVKHNIQNILVEYELFNVLGAKVASGNVSEEIDLNVSQSGIYELKIKKAGEIIHTTKLEIIKN